MIKLDRQPPISHNGLTWDIHRCADFNRTYVVLRNPLTLTQAVLADGDRCDRASRRPSESGGSALDTASATWGDYHDRVVGGWPKGKKRVATARQRLSVALGRAAIFGEREDCSWATTGTVRDIGRALTGDPEYCSRYDDVTDEQGTTMKMLCSVSCNSNVDVKSCTARGAAVAVLIRAIEAQGINVALDIVDESSFSTSGFQHYTIMPRIQVIRAGQLVSDERLAVALVGPDSCRRAGFSLLELIPAAYFPPYGYGNARPGVPAEVAEALGYDYVIPNISMTGSVFSTPEGTANWLRGTAVAMGLTVRR